MNIKLKLKEAMPILKQYFTATVCDEAIRLIDISGGYETSIFYAEGIDLARITEVIYDLGRYHGGECMNLRGIKKMNVKDVVKKIRLGIKPIEKGEHYADIFMNLFTDDMDINHICTAWDYFSNNTDDLDLYHRQLCRNLAGLFKWEPGSIQIAIHYWEVFCTIVKDIPGQKLLMKDLERELKFLQICTY